MIYGNVLLMKAESFLLLSLMVILPVLVSSLTPRRRVPPPCLLYNHTCVEKCPEGMHRYDSDCSEAFTQATCDNPKPVSVGLLCYWSRCDCNGRKLLHRETAQCYNEEDCPGEGCVGERCGLKPDADYDKMEYAPAEEIANQKFVGEV